MLKVDRATWCAVATLLFTASAFAAEANWPRWRGPVGDGHAAESGLPTTWDASSITWKTPLAGRGQSSPTIWGDWIFLTTALEDGKQRVVLCLNKTDGKVLWEQVAWTGEPEKSHGMNGWASASCATDGEIVTAFFGKGGLHAYTVEGKHLWSRDLGVFEGPWGTSACPVIVGDLVIQNGDADKDSFLEAFDRLTGKSAWRVPRPNHRGWSTPIVWKHHGREELVLNGHEGVTAYDVATGKTNWFSKNSHGRGEPTVTPGGDLLYVVCGLAGDMYALRPNAANPEPEVAWTAPRRGGRDLSSPIVIGDYVLVCTLSGIATCYEAKTGKELWKERLDGQFSATPIAIGGLALFISEKGETVVIEPGPALKTVARNSLGETPDEIFRASLTPLGGKIYIRSDKQLYCVAKAGAAENGPDWSDPMKEVHTRFTGKPGTLAIFGDSITISMAFWAPLHGEPKAMSKEMAAAHKTVKGYMRPECWDQWRGPKFGNNGSMTIRWAHENIDAWLKAHNPEAAVIMFGTNDLGALELKEFEEKTAEVVDKCLKNGTIAILTSLPPRSGLADKSKEFAQAVRRIAKQKHVPLIDYHADILKRRPDDWDGTLAKFKDVPGNEYEVPTLIARDGVHPSNPAAHKDFSEESLSRNGFALRNYLTVVAYAEVIEHVLRPQGAK